MSDNKVPNTPDYTATFGAQLSKAVTSAATCMASARSCSTAPFHYDETNLAEQEAYSLANFRAGVRWKYLFAEGWVRNAFDTDYIPLAFPYPARSPGSSARAGGHGRSGLPEASGSEFVRPYNLPDDESDPRGRSADRRAVRPVDVRDGIHRLVQESVDGAARSSS